MMGPDRFRRRGRFGSGAGRGTANVCSPARPQLLPPLLFLSRLAAPAILARFPKPRDRIWTNLGNIPAVKLIPDCLNCQNGKRMTTLAGSQDWSEINDLACGAMGASE